MLYIQELSEDDIEEKHAEIERYFADVQRDSMRRSVLDTGKRMDATVLAMKFVQFGAKLIHYQCLMEVLISTWRNISTCNLYIRNEVRRKDGRQCAR